MIEMKTTCQAEASQRRKLIEHAGLVWEVHSPALFVHNHDDVANILVGCNGRTWQLGILVASKPPGVDGNDTYRPREFSTRQAAMEAYAKGLEEARRQAEAFASWNAPL